MESGTLPEISQAIAPFLAELDQELIGRVPQDARAAYVGETEFWLERQALDFHLLGLNLKASAEKAMSRHGTPKAVALALAESFFESEVDSAIVRRVGRANTIAGALLGIGNLIVLILIEVAVFLPSDTARLPFSPAIVRSVIPENLMLPELSWQFLVPTVSALAAPAILGALVGSMVPVYAHKAVYRVMCPVLLSAFLLGCALLPNTAGLMLALFETVFWLPVGCLAAHISSSLVRRQRAKKEGGTAGTRPPRSKPLGAT